MKIQETELQSLLKWVAKKYDAKRQARTLSEINKNLYKFLNVDVNKLKILKLESQKELKNYLKSNNLSKCYLLIIYPNYNRINLILTNSEDKMKNYCLGYYDYEKVRIGQAILQEQAYIIYADKEDIDTNLKLQEQRIEIKKNSSLDPNSILYRSNKRYGYKDKSGYSNKMGKIYRKFFNKFLNSGTIEDIINYISNKEVKLFNLYQESRNKVFKKNKEYIDVFGYASPCFDYELKTIIKAIYNLKNKKELYFEEEIYNSFDEIMQKELSFKTRLNIYIANNNK